ncbi:MAG: IS3 family transposase [Clostridia bacterium]|nr:IS3 family transposase [Clostridia bacterium]
MKQYQIVQRYSKEYPISILCKMFEVSRSGYYVWLKRKDKDEKLAGWIKQCQEETGQTYGYRRVKMWIMREKGQNVNHKAIIRVARKYKLQAVIRRSQPNFRYGKPSHKYPNILNRKFDASEPNKKWVTDITYIPTGRGFVYMAAVMDLYDNYIVDYSIARDQTASLVTDTIGRACKNEKFANGLILHSDQGTQYTSHAYKALSEEHSFLPSMSRAGNPYDNAVMENFFGILKTECLYRTSLRNFDEAEEIVNKYVTFYNYRRLKLKTSMTPYEKRCMAQ